MKLTGRALEIVTGRSELSVVDVSKYRDRFFASGVDLPSMDEDAAPLSSVGTQLHSIIAKETGVEIPCNECAEEISSLDLMTVLEAASKKEQVVDGIYRRAWDHASWKDKLKLAADTVLATASAGKVNVGKSVIGGWFDRALKDGTAQIVKKRKGRAKKCNSCGQRTRRRARGGRGLTMPLMKDQRRLHAACQSAPKPQPNPYTDTPTRNMIWHCWPVEGWRKHIERIHDLAATCEGERIIGLSISPDSATADEVREILGGGFTYLEFENKGRNDATGSGEVQTLRAALPLLDSSDPNSVTVYGHCKGVRSHTRTSEAVHLWCDLMWEMVALNHAQADEAMQAGSQMFGAFRTFGSAPLRPLNGWHYSGTFFQFRTASLLADGIPPVKGGYGGTEAWPGDCIPPQDAACIFADGLPFKTPYDLKNWVSWIDQAFEWEVARIGGPRTEQHQRELLWFLDRLEGVSSLLVIGSKHGGLEHHIGQRYPGIKIVSVDIAPQADNAAPEIITGSSADPVIQRRLREDYEFDAAFIDGDHTLEGVTADWEFAKTLGLDRIYFHDVADGLHHRIHDCHVHELWADIKKTHITDEKIVGCGWGGIGEVLL